MARPKKTINFDYGVIDNAPQGQVHKIGTYATDVGVSGPTMRQRIAEHYGDRVTFIRGRAGGFIVTAQEAPQMDVLEQLDKLTIQVQEDADATTA